MTQSIITAGDASVGLATSAGNDGTLVLQTGAAGSKVNAVSFAADGTPTLNKALLQPVVAFSAYQSSIQGFGAGATNKIVFQTKEFDTASAFDNTTNYRFQPAISGYYSVQFGCAFSTGTASIALFLYKNGVSLSAAPALIAGNTTGSAVVYLNGTSDYIEIFGNSSTAQNTVAQRIYTYFQGILMARA